MTHNPPVHFEQNEEIEKLIDSFEIKITGSVREIQWCGDNNEVILMLDSEGIVQRSSDKGRSWQNMHEEFKKKAALEQETQDEEIGNVRRIINHIVDKRALVFTGTHGFNWQSDNCAETLKALNHGRPMEDFLFHPTEIDLVMATAQSMCEDFGDEEPCSIYKELQQSADMGITWTHLLKYVVDFDWAFQKGADFNKNRIIASFEVSGHGHQSYGTFKHEIDLTYSDDFFKTHHIILQGGNKFVTQKKQLLAAKPVDTGEQTIELQVSDISSGFTSFRLAELPLRGIQDKTYSLVASSSDQLWINVRHQGTHEEQGNIYTSDSSGSRFNLSLLHNARDEQGICDIAKIESLTGVFIANYYESSNGGASYHDNGSPKKLDSQLKSVITFNRGGIWRPIKYNSLDSKHEHIYCPDAHCALHLHNFGTHNFGPIQSNKNSVGIIIGVGNVGQRLENSPTAANTWISINGGLSFQEILKGSHIYEMGDHGSLIVLADDQNETNEAKFSWNQGLSWESYKFSTEKMQVENIATDPQNKGRVFQVYGHNVSNKGIVHVVDLSRLHEPQCTGIDFVGSDQSDFEWFIPAVESETGCLLGRQIQYARRKRDHQCQVGEQMQRHKFVKYCRCTEEDWECDIGYHRDLKNFENQSTCITLRKHTEANPHEHGAPANCPPGSQYEISSGYRAVPGTKCQGGIDHSPILMPCPGSQFAFGNFRNMLQFIVVILGAVILILFKDAVTGLFSGGGKGEQQSLDEVPQTIDNGSYNNFEGVDGDDKKYQ